MIRLLTLITENVDDDINVDLWDNWVEYLKYNQYDLPKDELKKLVIKFKLTHESKLNQILILSDAQNTCVYLEYNKNNDTFDYIKDIDDWMYNLTTTEIKTLLNMTSDAIYNGCLDCTLDDMKSNPGKVYHYTTEDKWDEIQQSGELRGSHGTGLTNRYVYGIFTSVDPEEHAAGSYGNVCLQINLDEFKKFENLNKLDLSYEPEIEEFLLRDVLRAKLDLDQRETDMDLSGGMSPYTVIVGHKIPLRFITQL